MQLQGTIKYIGQVIERKGKDEKVYRSQKLLLATTDGQYSHVYPIDIGTKLQDSMDQFSIGQTVTIHVNMRGNEYVDKTTNTPDAFLSLQAWKIEGGNYQTQANQVIQQEVAKGTDQVFGGSNVEDLPF